VVDDSPSWRAFTGQTYEQWRDSGWLDVFHPEDRDRSAALWKHAVATKTPVETEYRIRRKDGEWRWTAARAIPLFNDDDTVREWVGMNTDITDRKRSIELLRLGIEAAPTGMLMTDRAGTIRLVNVQIEKLFGYTRDELIGKTVEVLIPERFCRVHPGHRTGFSHHPQARPMGAGRDLHGLRKDGAEIPVEIALNPIQTEDGDFVLSSVVDITERKRAEQATERLTAQLRTLNADRVAFSEYAQSLARTVFQAIDVSPSTVSLDLSIDDVALAVDKAIPCGLVLNELITNSLKHGFTNGRAGTVRVEFSRLERGRLRLAVSDNGVGLPEEFDIATSQSLGLQLVSTLSHQLDAELEVTGRDGASVQLTFAADG